MIGTLASRQLSRRRLAAVPAHVKRKLPSNLRVGRDPLLQVSEDVLDLRQCGAEIVRDLLGENVRIGKVAQQSFDRRRQNFDRCDKTLIEDDKTLIEDDKALIEDDKCLDRCDKFLISAEQIQFVRNKIQFQGDKKFVPTNGIQRQ